MGNSDALRIILIFHQNVGLSLSYSILQLLSPPCLLRTVGHVLWSMAEAAAVYGKVMTSGGNANFFALLTRT